MMIHLSLMQQARVSKSELDAVGGAVSTIGQLMKFNRLRLQRTELRTEIMRIYIQPVLVAY